MDGDSRLLFLTKYGRGGASSRYRVLQYLPYLEAHGFRCDVQSLHSDEYAAAFFGRRRISPPYYVDRVARRVGAVLRAPRYSAVFIQKEIVPYLPPVLELVLKSRRVRIVYDLDDAIFLLYDESKHALVRCVLSSKIPTVLRWSTVVLAGNTYLHRYALAHNRRVVLFPTVVDHSKYRPRSHGAPSGQPLPGERMMPVVGWIGSPETVRYLTERADLLRRIAARIPFELRIIGAPGATIPGIEVRVVPWAEETEADELARCDVGVMPLGEDEWVKGKCGLKLLQYMAAGLPVVSSPDGGAEDIVRHGLTGFVARTEGEWYSYVLTLLDNPGLRGAMGSAGRARLEQQFSLAVWAPRMADLLRACIREEPQRGVRP
jgi:glycosyltransferase involved in cell wall biosynthesis